MPTNKENARNAIAELVKTKLVVKRSVFLKTKEVFQLLKEVLEEMKADLQKKTQSKDPIMIEVTEIGEYEVRLRIGGDTMVFLMHSNVFDFDKSHKIHKNSYVQKQAYNAFCGQIYMYNFLSDSFKYSRVNDYGYLIARLFVNNDLHYFIEGKNRLSFLFNDFCNAVLDKKQLSLIIDEVLLDCLEFDLYSPPYQQVEMVTVDEITQVSNNLRLQTGKRLGFKFKSDAQIK